MEDVMKQETALSVIANYSVMKMDSGDLAEILSENLGGQQLSTFDLDSIKVPAGGGTQWEVPTLEGITESKTIHGVVVFFKDQNGMWEDEYTGENSPPDCSADNGQFGEGTPGGVCQTCPLNQFGSGKGGTGKKCKNMRRLFILRESDILPIVINVPPSSLRDARKYFLRLASQGVPYYGVVTEFTLKKDKNEGGIVYSKIELALKDRLPVDAIKTLKAFQEKLKPAFAAARVEHPEQAEKAAESQFPEEADTKEF